MTSAPLTVTRPNHNPITVRPARLNWKRENRRSTGGFRFAHLPEGRYFLAVLFQRPASLSLNASIPGQIELRDAQRLELGKIRLSLGKEGEDVSLSRDKWESTAGSVVFSENSEVDSAKLEARAGISGFVDSKLFGGGRARIKIVSEGPGVLEARFFTRDGHLVERWRTPLTESGFDELEVDTKGVEGYLQLLISAGPKRLNAKNVKVEVLSRG